MRKFRRKKIDDADLDITAFMNLMIVLVPVLLLGMVFSQITVVDVKLPESALNEAANYEKNHQVELVIRQDYLLVNFPQGVPVKTIYKKAVDDEAEEKQHDFALLSLTLQEVKRRLLEKGIEKKNITILSESDTDYQTIISAMDTVRSYQAVVAASVVDAALFPDISFGDAPANTDTSKAVGAES
ncbi:biopolymer transporter ExbD [Dasania sp. GY-MA-18]|uniref:Biopolymer transporter ExbD n=1 Tax=Dasania phycosphaerae TaxID=2950436 RepID=A0A9J6RKB4_9GAMM|nr:MULTISPECIES: biopolymer transporter ExbD [Dasania]MCR8922365.1 biopolymer transporter ExbD [Dasania sp. GY-MA-18]MCZ0864793.1 biopolymer transporter ExbD [Dasania phycosphaerae]MCZ0868521.1 biopolymer transporter ExbD [Dasania phycosphaerae]